MLLTPEDITTTGGRFDGDFAARDRWIPMPYAPETVSQLRIFLGDPQSGPLIWLTYGAPTGAPKRDALAYAKIPPHLHRTPTFRVALGDQPQQMLVNNRWYGAGEYFLLDANKFYNDPAGDDGYLTINIFADRRGVHPCFRSHAGMSMDEMIAWDAQMFAPLGDGLACLHMSNADAVAGVALSTRQTLDHGGQARGSIHDQADWTVLSDGSRVAVVAIGDATSGPIVLLSGNAPNAVESPAARTCVDSFRVVARGGLAIGEARYGAGGYVGTQAGAELGPVIHGADGSTQLLVISDRRGWRPVDAKGAPVASARLDEVAAVVERVCAGQA